MMLPGPGSCSTGEGMEERFKLEGWNVGAVLLAGGWCPAGFDTAKEGLLNQRRVAVRDAERPRRGSHVEHGNQGILKSITNPPH
jgi:hypothetical protein